MITPTIPGSQGGDGIAIYVYIYLVLAQTVVMLLTLRRLGILWPARRPPRLSIVRSRRQEKRSSPVSRAA